MISAGLYLRSALQIEEMMRWADKVQSIFFKISILYFLSLTGKEMWKFHLDLYPSAKFPS